MYENTMRIAALLLFTAWILQTGHSLWWIMFGVLVCL
jgi:hypothetical protein